MAFVIEGEPLFSFLKDEEVKNLPPKTAPFSEKVSALAAAFDYDTRRNGSVYLFTKRYTDPRDLPGVTLEECREALKDAQRLLAPFNPRYSVALGQEPEFQELAASLSAEQLHAMADRRAGLPVPSLSPRQRALLWRLALHFHVQFAEGDLQAALRTLNQVSNQEARFGWQEESVRRVFGYEALSEQGKARRFVVLGDASQAPVGETPNARSPSPPDTPADGAVPRASTLGKAVAALRRRADDKPALLVDEALAQKPVTVIGGEATSPLRLLEAIADIYGLRVKAEQDGSLRLTRPLWKVASSAVGLNEAVRRVIPKPLLEVLHLETREAVGAGLRELEQEAVRLKAVREAAEGLILPPEYGRRVEEHNRKQSRLLDQAGRYRFNPAILKRAALQFLFASLDSKLRAAPEGRVSFTALDARERMALALVFLARPINDISGLLGREVPSYVARFDQVVLTGGLSKKPDDPAAKTRFSLLFSRRLPGGGTHWDGPGVTGLERDNPR